MVRPSARSTVSVSPLAATFVAVTDFSSLAEELIPCLQNRFAVPDNQSPDLANFIAVEIAASSDPHRFQPEFCHVSVALDMNMGRFSAVACVEEQPVTAFT